MLSIIEHYLAVPQQSFNQLSAPDQAKVKELSALWHAVYHTPVETYDLSFLNIEMPLEPSRIDYQEGAFRVELDLLATKASHPHSLLIETSFQHNIMAKESLLAFFQEIVRLITEEGTAFNILDYIFEYPVTYFYQDHYESFVVYRAQDEAGDEYDVSVHFNTPTGKLRYLIYEKIDEHGYLLEADANISASYAEELSDNANLTLSELLLILGDNYKVTFNPLSQKYEFFWDFKAGHELASCRARVNLDLELEGFYPED